MLINERNAFADHYKDIVDEGKKSLTQKIINYKNLEGLEYNKIKSNRKIRKNYCTKSQYIEADEFKEDGSAIFKEDNSINLKIKFFHYKAKYHPIIKFELYEKVLAKNGIKHLKDYTIDKFLKTYFCVEKKERKKILEFNKIDGNKTKIDDNLIKTGLKIPEGIIIQEPYSAWNFDS